jgi:hypothetical protein
VPDQDLNVGLFVLKATPDVFIVVASIVSCVSSSEKERIDATAVLPTYTIPSEPEKIFVAIL